MAQQHVDVSLPAKVVAKLGINTQTKEASFQIADPKQFDTLEMALQTALMSGAPFEVMKINIQVPPSDKVIAEIAKFKGRLHITVDSDFYTVAHYLNPNYTSADLIRSGRALEIFNALIKSNINLETLTFKTDFVYLDSAGDCYRTAVSDNFLKRLASVQTRSLILSQCQITHSHVTTLLKSLLEQDKTMVEFIDLSNNILLQLELEYRFRGVLTRQWELEEFPN